MEGREPTLELRQCAAERGGEEKVGALEPVSAVEAYDRESDEAADGPQSSLIGGGLVSLLLRPERRSDTPDEADERSEAAMVWVSGFMLTRTEAASSSWTC